MRLLVVVFATVFGAACVGSGGGEAAWVPADPAMMKAVDELVNESLDVGAIKRLDANAHQVWVNPVAWMTWDAAAKQDFTGTVAIYCDQHGSVHGRYVDVIDDSTGKRIAHYGPSGLEIF